MSLKSLLLALPFIVFLSAYAFLNDAVLGQDYLIGNFLAIPVYGGLILFILLGNPLLRRVSKRLAYSGRDIAVAIALVLAACFVPGQGLMYHFGPFMMMPHHFARINPGWQEYKVMQLLPRPMLADISNNETVVLDGFVQGLGVGISRVPFVSVPWYAWWKTLSFWTPFILSMVLAVVGLSLVVHRQWTRYEQIPYPLAQFAFSLLPQQGKILGPVFYSRAFQIALVLVFLFHMNNYACAWWPRHLIPFVRYYDFSKLNDFFPLYAVEACNYLFLPVIYFSVIAFAYFVSTDVSFSLGISPLVFGLFCGVMAKYGISVHGPYMTLSLESFMAAGAYLAFFVGLLYSGRHHYLGVLKKGIFLSGEFPIKTYEKWGVWLVLIGSIGHIALLSIVGLEWQLATAYTFICLVVFLVLSRVVAETGAFYIKAAFFPGVVLWGFMGDQALGPTQLLIMLVASSALMIDTRECLMPFFVHGLKLVEMAKEQLHGGVRPKLSMTCVWSVVGIVLALAIAIPSTIYWQYDRGATSLPNPWGVNQVPVYPFNGAVEMMKRLTSQNVLESASTISGWERLAHLQPRLPYLAAFGSSFVLVIVCVAGRLRFRRWPLHPVFFLIIGQAMGIRVGPSFLLGCLIKVIVMKYGGAAGYQKLKPLMIGVIAGECLAGVAIQIIGALYYAITGDPPMKYNVFAL